MAILRSVPRRRRGPSYGGRVMVDAVRGVLRVRRWPKKRGTPTSESQLWWVDWFRQANLLAKYADPMSQARAIEITAGSGMYPRDLLLKAMRGRLFAFSDQDGWKWYSMAAIQDISESLDVLAQTVGSVLVRAADRWRSPPPGNPGDVLTLQAAGTPPEWQAPGGGGGGSAGALCDTLANQAVPNNAWTPVNFTNEVYDDAAIHDNAVNPSRFTIPAGWTRCRLSMNCQWAASNVGQRSVGVHKNGARFVGWAVVWKNSNASAEQATQTPAVPCVAGDYFEMVVYQNTGAPLNVIGPSLSTYCAIAQAG